MTGKRIMSHGLIGFIIKASWAALIVSLLADAEPFWHQLIRVLGGAVITGSSTVAAALITIKFVRRDITKPVEEVREDLTQHREPVEHHNDDM